MCKYLGEMLNFKEDTAPIASTFRRQLAGQLQNRDVEKLRKVFNNEIRNISTFGGRWSSFLTGISCTKQDRSDRFGTEARTSSGSIYIFTLRIRKLHSAIQSTKKNPC